MYFLRIGRTIIEKLRAEHDAKWTHFCDYCRSEIAGDVISGEILKTIEGYALVNFEAAIFSSHLRNVNTTVSPLEPHFRGTGAKCLIGYSRGK